MAAVARIYRPGTKFDHILTLDGIQGIGKSTVWKVMAGIEYFSDALSLTDMEDKAGAEKLQGFWIVEIGELAGMKRAEIERVKSFITTTDDKYRPSYGRVVESHPRQCIMVATVNGENGYLRDITGNRRFWVVKCRQTEQKVRWEITPELRDQIWAEAKYYYEQGEDLNLPDDVLQEAEEGSDVFFRFFRGFAFNGKILIQNGLGLARLHRDFRFAVLIHRERLHAAICCKKVAYR